MTGGTGQSFDASPFGLIAAKVAGAQLSRRTRVRLGRGDSPRSGEPVWPQLGAFIASGYLFKALAALVDTLPFYLLVGWLRRWLEVPGDGAELLD